MFHCNPMLVECTTVNYKSKKKLEVRVLSPVQTSKHLHPWVIFRNIPLDSPPAMAVPKIRLEHGSWMNTLPGRVKR